MSTQLSLTSRSLSALGWSYAGALLRALSQLVIQVALARMLGPEAFGQAAIVMVVLGFGWLLAEGGFGSALVQKSELAEGDIAYALGWVLSLSVAMGALICLSAPWLSRMLGDPCLEALLYACGPLVPLQAISNIPLSLLRRNLDLKRQQLINVGGYVFGMGGVAMLMAWLGYGAWSLVIGFAVQTLMALIWGYAYVRFPLRLRWRGDRSLRNFGLSVVSTNMANWAIENLDRFFIGKLWGTTSLGEYAAAGNLSRAPASLLVGAAQTVAFSSASRVQEDTARMGRGFCAASCMVLLITAPAFVFLAMHADFVMQLLYGQRWANAAPLFAVLCLAVPSYAVLSISGPVLWAAGLPTSELKVQLLIVALLLIGLFTLRGLPLLLAVWLVPALYVLRAGLVTWALARRIDLTGRRVAHTYLAGILLALLVALFSAACQRMAGLGNWAEVGLASATGLLGCLLLLRLGSRWMLVPDLRQMLLARADASGLPRVLCALLGLRKVPA